jgi:hypothetical protein
VAINIGDTLIVAFSKQILEAKVCTPCSQLDECDDEGLFRRAVAFSVSYSEMWRRI